MCGVFGIINLTGDIPLSRDRIITACHTMSHRGPDEYGVFQDDNVVLCHQRLSIIDLEGGKQPMTSDNGLITITYNGEVYNYREIRKSLEKLGHKFHTDSDTEVILHAYEQYAEKCFGLFDGMFAIGIWDKAARKLFLARDRTGKKPLYYFRNNNFIIFGSELKSLISSELIPTTIDPTSTQDYLTLGYVPTPKTIYKNVYKLEAATYLDFHKDHLSKHQYWDLQYSADNEKSYSDIRRSVKDELEKSVQMRLVSDVPFGAFLSGGIDSSVVVSIMQKYLQEPVKTFSIGFDERKYSELDDAKLISDHIGTKHTEFVLTKSCRDIVEEFSSFYDEPFGDSSSLPTFYVSKIASDHVKMVLTGDGGDECFGGYKRYSRYLINEKLKNITPSSKYIQQLLLKVPGRYSRKVSRLLERVHSQFPLNYIKEVTLSSTDTCRNLLQDSVDGYDTYVGLSSLYKKQQGKLDSIYYGDIKSYLLDDILVKVDRMSMANSIEVRSPFLDHNLLELSAQIPTRYKTNSKMGKLILRDVARDYLPQEVINKKKRGFAIPLKEWFHHDLYSMLMDYIKSQRGAGLEIFNMDLIEKMLDDHRKSKEDNSQLLWLVLCFLVWSDIY